MPTRFIREAVIAGDSPQTLPRAVRRVILLIALTAGLSLLHVIQHYLGGPVGLSLTSETNDLALNPRGTLIAEVADVMERMADGMWAEQAPPSEFFTNPKEERTRQFLAHIL